MPKGVEHRHNLYNLINQFTWIDLWCRKALSTLSRDTWASRECPWIDLWCRKALSTHVRGLLSAMRSIWIDLWCRKALSTLWRCMFCLNLWTGLIFDAERRWAPILPELQTTLICWIDLWCRKALSTSTANCIVLKVSSGLIFDAERRWALFSWGASQLGLTPGLIFDAERRWALLDLHGLSGASRLDWSLMPKGVEHGDNESRLIQINNWIDLWCRKALSTLLRIQYKGAVMILDWSLMPKGVEHMESGALIHGSLIWIDLWCRKALSTSNGRYVYLIKIDLDWSLMPKGVEHVIEYNSLAKNTSWIDLWCRKALSTFYISYSLQGVGPGLIFDAERRWAPIAAVGVTHKNGGWIDLWCRKALSTVQRGNSLWKENLDWSLMPKGVEHIISKASSKSANSGLIFDAERRWAPS